MPDTPYSLPTLEFSLFGNNVTNRGSDENTRTNNLFILNTASPIAFKGIITEWSFYNIIANKKLRLIVMRPTNSGEFQSVGTTDEIITPDVGVVTKTATEIGVIYVEPGDVLAVYFKDVNPISFEVSAPCTGEEIYYKNFNDETTLQTTYNGLDVVSVQILTDNLPCRTYSLQVKLLTTGKDLLVIVHVEKNFYLYFCIFYLR